MVTQAAIVRPVRKPLATRNLVCLGFCGGGTRVFRTWEQCLDADTELVLPCYPGREGRFAEEYAADWAELADDATNMVLAAADRPYVLFGHSMGGWMAFDVATRLERAELPAPDLVVVSSCNAPDRGVTGRDRFLSDEHTDSELLAWMRVSRMIPEHILADPELTDMALRLTRADIRVRDSYRYSGAVTRLPVRLLYGTDDHVVEPGAEAAWRAVCHGAFRVTRLPGGHFYTARIWESLPAFFLAGAGALPATHRPFSRGSWT